MYGSFLVWTIKNNYDIILILTDIMFPYIVFVSPCKGQKHNKKHQKWCFCVYHVADVGKMIVCLHVLYISNTQFLHISIRFFDKISLFYIAILILKYTYFRYFNYIIKKNPQGVLKSLHLSYHDSLVCVLGT